MNRKKRNQIDTQTYLNLKTTAIIVVKHEWMAWLFNEINWFELISMELTAQTFWSPWSYVALIWSHHAHKHNTNHRINNRDLYSRINISRRVFEGICCSFFGSFKSWRQRCQWNHCCDSITSKYLRAHRIIFRLAMNLQPFIGHSHLNIW